MCVCKYACASVSLLLTRSAQVEDAQKNLLEVRRFRGAFLTRMKHALVELEDSQGFNLLITCFIIGNISFMAVGVFVSRCFAFILDGVLGTHSLMTSFFSLMTSCPVSVLSVESFLSIPLLSDTRIFPVSSYHDVPLWWLLRLA